MSEQGQTKGKPDVQAVKDRMREMLGITELCLMDLEVVRATAVLEEAALKCNCLLWCIGQDNLPTLHGEDAELAYGVALKRYEDAHRDWILAMDRALDWAAKKATAVKAARAKK